VQKAGLTGLEVNGSCRASPPCLVYCLYLACLFVPARARIKASRIVLVPGQKIVLQVGLSCFVLSVYL
jgi:hypothetical protein